MTYEKLNTIGESSPIDYETYYRKKIYDTRFHRDDKEKITIREIELIKLAARVAVEEIKESVAYWQKESDGKQPFRVLSFGAGSVREWHAIKLLAVELGKSVLDMEFIAYDISSEGLNIFKEKLEGLNYHKVYQNSLPPQKEGERGYQGAIFKKDNMTIKIIYGHQSDTLEHTSHLLGKYELMISMFGVFNHVLRQKALEDLLGMLSKNCTGAGVFTVATLGLFKEEQKTYNWLRHARLEDYQELQEKNTLRYSRISDNDVIRNFYRLLELMDISNALAKSGWKKVGGFEVASFNHPAPLSKKPLLETIDNLASRAVSALHNFLPENRFTLALIERMTSYIGVVIKPQSNNNQIQR